MRFSPIEEPRRAADSSRGCESGHPNRLHWSNSALGEAEKSHSGERRNTLCTNSENHEACGYTQNPQAPKYQD